MRLINYIIDSGDNGSRGYAQISGQQSSYNFEIIVKPSFTYYFQNYASMTKLTVIHWPAILPIKRLSASLNYL